MGLEGHTSRQFMSENTPGEVELYCFYKQHLGPCMESAGLRVQFHYNQAPGIHFRVQPRDEFRQAILQGIEDGLAERFPDFPPTGAIWIKEITEHESDSSARAFYRAGRLVVDQAYALKQSATANNSLKHDQARRADTE
jgi:hypothetical protein